MVDALVIVAHPDDETIWMGGTILKKSNWKWTIISLCRKDDPDRAPRFHKVCKVLKAKSIISNLDDEKLNDLPTIKVEKKIKQLLPKNKYDCIYTHGRNGEYGHKRHKEIHRAIKKLISKKELQCKQAFYFSYKQGPTQVPGLPDLRVAIARVDADARVKLSRDNFKKKQSLINHEYGFRSDSFEVLSSGEVEAFDKK